MSKNHVLVLTGIVLLGTASVASAQTSWGNALKSAAGAATQAAVQTLTPQAQTTVDAASKLAAGAPQENFILAKAKEYIAAGNYQTALDLGNYVITTINSKSVDAKKIMTDAKTALMKMAKDKLAQTPQTQAQAAAAKQTQADVVQTGNSLKGLFGTIK